MWCFAVRRKKIITCGRYLLEMEREQGVEGGSAERDETGVNVKGVGMGMKWEYRWEREAGL